MEAGPAAVELATPGAGGSAGAVTCRQALLPDGSIHSQQSLLIPRQFAAQLSPGLLLERYLKLVRSFTFSLVRPAWAEQGIEFRLAGTRLALLRFRFPEYRTRGAAGADAGSTLYLQTVGGLLVRPGEPGQGRLSFAVRQESGGVRVLLELAYSRPLLLGSDRPSPLRRLLFSISQGRIHKMITVRFLRELSRDLTGEPAPPQVRHLSAVDGEDI